MEKSNRVIDQKTVFVNRIRLTGRRYVSVRGKLIPRTQYKSKKSLETYGKAQRELFEFTLLATSQTVKSVEGLSLSF
jgi:hypothetical protein